MDVSKRLFAFNVLLKSNDILTTTLAVVLHGVEAEGNPIVKYSIESLGLAPAMLLNFVVFYLMVVSLAHKKSVGFLMTVAFLSASVVVNNIIGLMIL